MAELEWTTEKPTKPGRYVYCPDPKLSGFLVHLCDENNNVGDIIPFSTGWWYGPLPEVKT